MITRIKKPGALTSDRWSINATNLKYLDCRSFGIQNNIAKISKHKFYKNSLFVASCSTAICMMISFASRAQEIKSKRLKPELIIQSNFEGTTHKWCLYKALKIMVLW